MNKPTRVTRTILIGFFIGSVLLTACGGGGSTTTAGGSSTATAGSVLKGQILFGRYNRSVDGFQIFTINPDGTHEVQLLPGAADCPSFAPGGSKILVCVSNPKGLGRPATLNPDGSGFTLLDTSDPSLNLPCGAWSSRGKLACEGWDDIHPTRTPGIFTVRSSDGGGLVRVTANPYGGHDIPGSYSPDGTRIVFGRENANLHQFALFVANANGSDLRQISGWQPDFAGASWSPDGQWILTGNGEGGLSRIHPDGSGQRQIVLAPNPGSFLVCWPKWSPDGQHIVFILSAACGGSHNLISIARADGSDLRQVTPTSADVEFPDWGQPSS